MSISSVQEPQQLHEYRVTGSRIGESSLTGACVSTARCGGYGGTARLLTLLPCTTPPLLTPSQCTAQLSSPFQLECGRQGLSREPSFYAIASVQSGSSHNQADSACDTWDPETSRKDMSRPSCSSMLHDLKGQNSSYVVSGPSKQTSYLNYNDECECESDARFKNGELIINAANAAGTMEALEDMANPQMLTAVPQTEYIVVDVPLQMGMGSPYSSSFFILIDR